MPRRTSSCAAPERPRSLRSRSQVSRASLVPFPHAVDDHQTVNAHFLADAGAAVLAPQSELSPERLAELIAGFDRERLSEMAKLARSLGRPEAARHVAQICMELAK